MAESEGRPVLKASSAADLLGHFNTSQTRYFELSARRRDGFDGDADEVDNPESEGDELAEPTIDIFSAHDAESLITRMRVTLAHPAGEFVVDGAVRFGWSSDVEYVGDTVVMDFVQRVGVPYIYPYLRTMLADMAARIEIPQLNLGQIRLDKLQISEVRPGDDDAQVGPAELSAPSQV